MGGLVNHRATTAVATIVVVLIVVLNGFLVSQTLFG
jgi:Mn2+/Fe2+ NRAMP family transporter